MPPKSGKKKKINKEEEERKAREEEEARLQAEREEVERKERERYEAEERRRLENEEKKLRRAELEALTEITSKDAEALFQLHDERRRSAKWERYMRCDGSPDPTIAGEINTYLNLWRENNARIRIDEVLGDSHLALELKEELEFILNDTPKEDLDESKRNQYHSVSLVELGLKWIRHCLKNRYAAGNHKVLHSTILDLEQIVHEKLMLASYNVLVDATKLQDNETSNLQFIKIDKYVEMYVWANLSKNPRIKLFQFERVTFDIPRLLRLADCAIVLLFTKFDHFSPKCWTYTAHIKEKEEVPKEPTPLPVEEEQKEEGEGEQGADKEETEDVMAALRRMDEPDKEEEQPEGEPVVEEPEEIVPEDLVKTPEPLDFVDFRGEEEIIDLRAYNVIGGVFHFKLVHLPPQPKVANTLIMTQIEDPVEMQPMEYISDVLIKQEDDNQSNEEGKDNKSEKEKDDKKKEEKPPITLSVKLPEDVSVVDEPVMGRWVEEAAQWRNDGFIDTNYNDENRTVTFTTPYFGTFAMFQDTHINMPFQSWEIRPRGIDHVLYTIIAAISEVTIEIKGSECCLHVGEAKELSHLKNEWMTPKVLIKTMKTVGINLFPAIDSWKYVSVQEKNAIAEERLYAQMAMTASSMAYTWSRWNMACEDTERIVVQASECMEDQPIREEDWSLFMVTRKRITKLKMSEFEDSETFSDDFAEGTNFHADMYHMVMDIVSEQAQERINNSSATFVDCVKQLLEATKPVTYS